MEERIINIQEHLNKNEELREKARTQIDELENLDIKVPEEDDDDVSEKAMTDDEEEPTMNKNSLTVPLLNSSLKEDGGNSASKQ